MPRFPQQRLEWCRPFCVCVVWLVHRVSLEHPSCSPETPRRAMTTTKTRTRTTPPFRYPQPRNTPGIVQQYGSWRDNAPDRSRSSGGAACSSFRSGRVFAGPLRFCWYPSRALSDPTEDSTDGCACRQERTGCRTLVRAPRRPFWGRRRAAPPALQASRGLDRCARTPGARCGVHGGLCVCVRRHSGFARVFVQILRFKSRA